MPTAENDAAPVRKIWPACPVEGMRLNKRDWQIINAALALAECDWDADEDVLPSTLARLNETRRKVHAQLARYSSDPYAWNGRRPI